MAASTLSTDSRQGPLKSIDVVLPLEAGIRDGKATLASTGFGKSLDRVRRRHITLCRVESGPTAVVDGRRQATVFIIRNCLFEVSYPDLNGRACIVEMLAGPIQGINGSTALAVWTLYSWALVAVIVQLWDWGIVSPFGVGTFVVRHLAGLSTCYIECDGLSAGCLKALGSKRVRAEKLGGTYAQVGENAFRGKFKGRQPY
jgi:hypothetical protein